MVWRVANFIVTSCQLVGRVGRVEFGERHDKRTNQQQTAGRPIMSAHGNYVTVYVKEWLRRVHVYKF